MSESATGGLFVRLAVRNLFRNPRRSLLTLLGIVVGVCGTVGLSALARGVSDQMVSNAIRNMIGHIQIHQAGFLNDPTIDNSMESPAPELRTEFEQQKFLWSRRVRVPGVVMSERESAGVTMVGIDPEAEKKISFIADGVVAGRELTSVDDDGIIIGKKLAENLQTQLGKRLVLMSQDTEQHIADRGIRVIGIFDAELESVEKTYVFVSITRAQEMLKLGDRLSEIIILTPDREAVEGDVSRLRRIAPQLDVQPWTAVEPLLMALRNVQSGFLRLWFVIVVVTVAFGVVNTLFMSILERAREIGLLQSIGMKPRWIVFQVLLESTVLLGVGMILGNLLSLGLIYVYRGGIDVSSFAEGTAYIGVGRIIYPVLKSGDMTTANVLIGVLVLISSLYPAWKASRIDPVVAMRKA